MGAGRLGNRPTAALERAGGGWGRARTDDGDRHTEAGTLTRRALAFDRPAEKGHQPAHDMQANAVAVTGEPGGCSAFKEIKNNRKLSALDAGPSIADAQSTSARASRRRGQRDRTAGPVADGVAQEVADDLLQLDAVVVQRRQILRYRPGNGYVAARRGPHDFL